MKLLITLTLFLSISILCKAQSLEKKETNPISKNETIKEKQEFKLDNQNLKPEDIEKIKISKSTPTVFYIINDKPVSREAYMLYLSEQEKKKEENPNQQ
jgi:hypothetical protein